VDTFFKGNRPEYVFLVATTADAILANNIYPAGLIYDSLVIQANIINASCLFGVKKLMFLCSSCIYPKDCHQPIDEEWLLSGYPEPTSEPYAIAKIAGIKMCQAYNRQYGTNYVSVMSTNLYGPGDNYDLQDSYVFPELIRKIHEAHAEIRPFVEISGRGESRYEFLYIDDLADACLFLMQSTGDAGIINVGVGEDLSVKEFVQLIRDILGYKGDLRFDHLKPDSAPGKVLNITRLRKVGWKAKISLTEGIKRTCDAYTSFKSQAV
jgi:GDP-L-fucose synthase